jgi:starvation-inducible DNA-binding protein
MNDQLIKSMKTAHANTFAFYLKTQGFHWNVEGENFPQYHAFFETIYSEVYGVVDTFAEQIRALGSYAPAGLGRLLELSNIEDQREIVDARTMLEILYQDNQTVLESVGQAYELAENAGEHGLSNFLAERQDAHKKHAWMIRATLK